LQENEYDTGLTLQIPLPHFKLLPACCLGQNDFSARTTYLAGLLAPRDRPKTLTALAGAEPLIQAQAAPVQQLQFFLSESCWDADLITMRTLQLLGDDPLTASDADGVLV